MNKTYIIVLVLFGIVTLISMIPDAALIFALFTLGIGAFILIAVINLFAFLLCLFPLFIERLAKPAKYVLTVGLLAAALFGPSIISTNVARNIENATPENVARADVFKGRTLGGIEFIRPTELGANLRNRILTKEVCEKICQRLLHGGQFDWVRVIATDRKGVQSIATLKRGTTDGCAEALCYVFVSNTDAEPEVIIRLSESYTGPYNANGRAKGWAQSQGSRTLTVFDGAEQPENLVWRQTENHLFVINPPTYLMPTFGGLTSGGNKGGLHFPRYRDLRTPIKPVEIADALGITLAAWEPAPHVPFHKRIRKQPTIADANKIASLLDRDGDFTPVFAREVNDWLSTLNSTEVLSEQEITLVRQVVDDPRLPNPTSLSHLFSRKPELHDVLLPWFFNEMEAFPSKKPRLLSAMGYDLGRGLFEEASLAPYAERYRTRLVALHYDASMLSAAGRFGFNPTSLLRDAYAPARKNGYPIMTAICNSDPKWYQDLLPLTRELIRQEIAQGRPTKAPTAMNNALRFLDSMGHRDEARAIIEKSQWRHKENMLEYGHTKPGGPPIPPDKICR